jgi:hypothetical protein
MDPSTIVGCTCGCCGCGCGPGFRRFFSIQEEQECLEFYKDQLEKELDGIDERIKDLKKSK